MRPGEVGPNVAPSERAHQYARALAKVRRGLAVATATCSGSDDEADTDIASAASAMLASRRVARVAVELAGTAEVLPSTQAAAGGWSGPSTRESAPRGAGPRGEDALHQGEAPRESRIIGPIGPGLDVRVTGTSSFSYRAI